MKELEMPKRVRNKLSFYLLFFSSYLVFSIALAVTYNTDSANGPETLSTEVAESFESWKALDTKLEVTVTEENPESLFQYGTPERFSPDMLSITIQRQQDARQLIHLISPNADNRKRILLHEAGIAIGLTAQPTPNQATLSPATQPADEALEGAASPTNAEETNAENTGETSMENTTDTGTLEDSNTSENTDSENTNSSTATEETSENTDASNNTANDSGTENTTTPDTTQNESTSEDSESSSEPESSDSQEETAVEDVNQESTTLTTTVKPWETVMNPSINSEDTSELGEGEKELLRALNLFAKEDINKDGNINFYDLVAIAQALGQRNVNDPSDLNKDGIVNQADVDVLRKVYTFSDPSPTPPGQIEPSNPEGQTGPEDPSPIPEDTNTNE